MVEVENMRGRPPFPGGPVGQNGLRSCVHMNVRSRWVGEAYHSRVRAQIQLQMPALACPYISLDRSLLVAREPCQSIIVEFVDRKCVECDRESSIAAFHV